MGDDRQGTFSSGAWKRLERTRSSKAGWGQDHYGHLLTAFGFSSREGGDHRIYWDPEDKANRVSIPRHGELRAYVAEIVIEAVERMLTRKGLHP